MRFDRELGLTLLAAMVATACQAAPAHSDVDSASTPLAVSMQEPGSAPAAPAAAAVDAQQEPLSDDPSADEGWRFVVAPYLFASGLKGTVGSEDAAGDIEAEFDDLLGDLKFGGMLSLEAAPPRSRWSILADLIFVQLEGSGESTGPLAADAELSVDQFIGELSVAYAAMEDGRLDVLGGIRYWDLSAELEVDTGAGDETREGDADWVDPLIGVRSRLPLGSDFDVILRGDVGGFGVGSDISYNLGVGVGWSVSRVVELALGYRYLYVDYEDDVVYDVAQSGFLLGCYLSF